MNKTKQTVLIIDDDKNFQDVVRECIADEYEVHTAITPEKGLAAVTKLTPELVLLDFNLPKMNGLDLLKEIKSFQDPPPVIMLTGESGVSCVVETIKSGAADYLTKPIKYDELLKAIKRVLRTAAMKTELTHRRRLDQIESKDYEIISSSNSMTALRKKISIIANTDSNVLIEGESGTGKELIARQIHAHSCRRDNIFVALNCGAIAKELMEAEFFGYKKGAFTGAQNGEIGKFKLADNGTLLLDEIGELSTEAQVKLLRVLEESEFYPVGSNQLIKVNVRIIASTNRNLEKMVEEGKFREDLYYRLNIGYLKVPPLRERRDDILSLVNFFMNKLNTKLNKQFSGIADDAKETLVNHYWKGNVRELRNVIERIMIFEDDTHILGEHVEFIQESICKEELYDVTDLSVGCIDTKLEKLEKELIEKSLKSTNWNKSKAAKLLELSPQNLYYRMVKYGIK